MATRHDHLDKLLESARTGPIEEFHRLVQETMCINEVHPIKHERIVATLASEGRAEIVRYLIEQGAWPHSACFGAARGGHETLMNELIGRGASKHSAVWGAATGGHTKLMWDLIETGACLNSALEGAGENGDPTVIQELLDKRARPINVLWGAIRNGNQERIRTWLSAWEPEQSFTLIRLAAYHGQLTLVDELNVHCNASDAFYESVARNLAEGGWETPFFERYGEQSEYMAHGIWGAANGGHCHFLNRLIEHATQFALLSDKTALKYAVIGAAAGNHSKLVAHLIARGATIEDALVGAAIGMNTALMDALIAQGTASGQLRKDIAVYAAAVGKRYDLMNRWLIEGASINQALRGVSYRGGNHKLEGDLIAQGALAEWSEIGCFEGEADGNFEGNYMCRHLSNLLLKKHEISSIKVMAEYGYPSFLQHIWNKNLNSAVWGAARGGFRTVVSSLLEKGAGITFAIQGAVEVGDRDLIESLIPTNEQNVLLLRVFFKTTFETGQEDLLQWMLERLGQSGNHFFVYTLKFMKAEEVVRALSMIKNSHQQFEIAREADVVHLMSAVKIVRKSKVSPEIALALAEKNPESLRCLLNVMTHRTPKLPNEIKFQIFSQVAASEGFQVAERDISVFMRASIVAKKLADFNEVSDDEATELATIQQRLMKCQKRKPEAERKSTQLANAGTLYGRSDILSRHRNSFLTKPFLPNSIQHMMHKFDKYQNLLTLQKWLIACEERLSRKRQYPTQALDMRNLREKLNQLSEFMEETSDPAVLARYLKSEFEGKSLYSILKPLKYWKDCVKHFPNMVRVLEESSERAAESRSFRGCGW